MTHDTLDLWRHVFGDFGEATGYVCVGALNRKTGDMGQEFYAWLPGTANFAASWAASADRFGEDAYFCAHLLTAKQRRKPKAADVLTLYFEMDGGEIPAHLPRPTAVVESSPGHTHNYVRLTKRVAPTVAEALNRRLAYASGADPSGWDLTQLYRVPGTANHKYPDAPAVAIRYIEDRAYDPDELDRILPQAPQHDAARSTVGTARDFSGDAPPVRLNERGQEWWTGARVVQKKGIAGETDRSDTLFALGCVLAEANASAEAIAGALANRDQVLYHKYTARPDAAKQYAEIAGRALAKVAGQERPQSGGPSLAEVNIALQERDTLIATLRADVLRLGDQLRREQEEGARTVARVTELETAVRAHEAAATYPDLTVGGAAWDIADEISAAYQRGDTLTIEGKEYARCVNKKAAKRRSAPSIGRATRTIACAASVDTFFRKEQIETPTFKGEVEIAYYHLPPERRQRPAEIVLAILPPVSKPRQGGRKTITVPPEVAGQDQPVRRVSKRVESFYLLADDKRSAKALATRTIPLSEDYWTAQGEELTPAEKRAFQVETPSRVPHYRPTQHPVQDARTTLKDLSVQDETLPPPVFAPGTCPDCGGQIVTGGYCARHWGEQLRRHTPYDYADTGAD